VDAAIEPYSQTHTACRCFIIIVTVFFLAIPAKPGSADDRHACEFLTVDEVAKVLGMKIAFPEKQASNPLGQSICFFDTPQEPGVRFAQLQLVSSSSSGLKSKGFTAESLFDNNTGFIEKPVLVPAIGQKAFWGGSGMKLGAGLHVYESGVYFVVLAQVGDEDECLLKSVQLSKIVINNIHLK
jgi:hypothetical protein